jgi:hypothetical protein
VDFVFVTGTNAKDARVNERIDNLSGTSFQHLCTEITPPTRTLLNAQMGVTVQRVLLHF